MPARIQIPDSLTSILLNGGSISLSDLPARVKTTLIAYALESGIQISSKHNNSEISPETLAILSKGLPENPTQDQWNRMTEKERETYPDEIFWKLEANLI